MDLRDWEYNNKVAVSDTGIEWMTKLPGLLAILVSLKAKFIPHKIDKKDPHSGIVKNRKTKKIVKTVWPDRLPESSIGELLKWLIAHINISGAWEKDYGLGKLNYIESFVNSIACKTFHEDVDHSLFVEIGIAIWSRKFELSTMWITEVTKDSLDGLKIPKQN